MPEHGAASGFLARWALNYGTRGGECRDGDRSDRAGRVLSTGAAEAREIDGAALIPEFPARGGRRSGQVGSGLIEGLMEPRRRGGSDVMRVGSARSQVPGAAGCASTTACMVKRVKSVTDLDLRDGDENVAFDWPLLKISFNMRIAMDSEYYTFVNESLASVQASSLGTFCPPASMATIWIAAEEAGMSIATATGRTASFRFTTFIQLCIIEGSIAPLSIGNVLYKNKPCSSQ
ncbi:hypothetical protein CC1G_14065 [Coprinopsis cinerea okayama7|uniref:Uncharacterized protein n=1 Tax=Coprinopsis cinerea (strain Okayama-7 / 130 / ATCC MYA-4618 / FGSC 9003) TaxID=240176 RepID=D6RL38_COPC7|nr:hypothetical protein CC1G_14065 [Coprinopsis cinerea okayama7\|eukprot:XP_002911533.1 hypothetical protein CC1G_14065 [Coprinopsis cinerea okayama7\